jgi:acetyl-CoA synthetase
VLTVGAAQGQGDLDWSAALAAARPRLRVVATAADDPAVLIYTSGTTGPPKGALIPHRALIGNLSGFVCSQNWYRPGRRGVLEPADWAWTGGLMDALLPRCTSAARSSPTRAASRRSAAFELMQRHGVTHSFLFPTALKAMMKAVPEPRGAGAEAARDHERRRGGRRRGLRLVPRRAGRHVNEMFGQTEINYIVGNCCSVPLAGWPAGAAWGAPTRATAWR